MSELFYGWMSHCEMEDPQSPTEKASAQSKAQFILIETQKSFQPESDPKSQPFKKRKRKGSLAENGGKKTKNHGEEEQDDQSEQTSSRESSKITDDNHLQEESPTRPASTSKQPLLGIVENPLRDASSNGLPSTSSTPSLKIKIQANQSKVLYISNEKREKDNSRSDSVSLVGVCKDEFYAEHRKTTDHDYSSQYKFIDMGEDNKIDVKVNVEQKFVGCNDKVNDDAMSFDLIEDEEYKILQQSLKKEEEVRKQHLENELKEAALTRTQKFKTLKEKKKNLVQTFEQLEGLIISNSKFVEEREEIFEKLRAEQTQKVEEQKQLIRDTTINVKEAEIQQKSIEESIKKLQQELEKRKREIKLDKDKKERSIREVEKLETQMNMDKVKLDIEREGKNEENKILCKQVSDVKQELSLLGSELKDLLRCKF